MRTGRPKHIPRKEAGFSMVELLMTALILSIGLLGLALLQTMSLRASNGGGNLSTAVQLGEKLMDQINMEGRLTYNNKVPGTNQQSPTALTGLQYITATPSALDQYYNIDPILGEPVLTTAPVAGGPAPVFHVHMDSTVLAGTVGVTDVTINVYFTDGLNAATHTAITRTATLTRRILHD